MKTGHPAPLATDHIVSVDVLRGFAVLGILIMNIQSFSMPGGPGPISSDQATSAAAGAEAPPARAAELDGRSGP